MYVKSQLQKHIWSILLNWLYDPSKSADIPPHLMEAFEAELLYFGISPRQRRIDHSPRTLQTDVFRAGSISSEVEKTVAFHINMIFTELRANSREFRHWETMENVLAARRIPVDDIVELNVGGHIFIMERGTLRKHPGSMLDVMFSGRHSLTTDNEGHVVLDRDGRVFGHILQWLRMNAISDLSVDRRRVLLPELDFYGLRDPFLDSQLGSA